MGYECHYADHSHLTAEGFLNSANQDLQLSVLRREKSLSCPNIPLEASKTGLNAQLGTGMTRRAWV